MSLKEVLDMSLPQLFFIAWDKQPETAKTGIETKQEVDERYRDDPVYRERYAKMVADAKRRAKEGLIRGKEKEQPSIAIG